MSEADILRVIIFGLSVGLIACGIYISYLWAPAKPVVSEARVVNRPITQEDLIEVKVVEHCYGPNGGGRNEPWYLLETSDKQRGPYTRYRGEEGAKFLIPKQELDWYVGRLPKTVTQSDYEFDIKQQVRKFGWETLGVVSDIRLNSSNKPEYLVHWSTGEKHWCTEAEMRMI